MRRIGRLRARSGTASSRTADDQLVFTGPKGAQLRRSNFTRQWRKALEAAGLTDIHFHD
jgi:integrase